MFEKDYRGHTLKNKTRRSNGWFVSDGKGRVRWGTLAQVKGDVDHLETYGHFPDRQQGWA